MRSRARIPPASAGGKGVSRGLSGRLCGMKLRSTAKYRRKVLCGEVEAAFKGEVALICAERGWQLHALEVMPDHVHLFA